MTFQITYSKARASLATLCDRAVSDQEVILNSRRGWAGCRIDCRQRTLWFDGDSHLLRSPANAERLLTALAGARHK